MLGAQVDRRTARRSAVWAPNALEVQVAGEWAGWDGSAHPMSQLGGSGVWHVHVAGAGVGSQYKYRLRGADGQWARPGRPDGPVRREAAELASVVCESQHQWGDDAWMESAPPRPARRRGRCRPTRCTSPRGASTTRASSTPGTSSPTSSCRYVADLGFTHVELMPVMQHPFGGSWGYHVTSYFAADARFGDPDGLSGSSTGCTRPASA